VRSSSSGWVGEKSAQGFYKREKTNRAARRFCARSGDADAPLPAEAVGEAPCARRRASIDDPAERSQDPDLGKDKVGQFLRDTLGPTLRYTATDVADIATRSTMSTTRCSGASLELGPFEIIDASARMRSSGRRRRARGRLEGLHRRRSLPPGRRSRGTAADLQLLRSAKDRNRVVRKNAGASLVDLGDGVLALEFHSKMNAIGGDTIQMMHAA
jgi:3-hydroxyacyl-CoA dehydrogenase